MVVKLEANVTAYKRIKFLPVRRSSESPPSRDCMNNLSYDHSLVDNIQGIVTHRPTTAYEILSARSD